MTSEQQGRAAAAAFRAEHHLGFQPLGDLVALIERATPHDVTILDATPDEHGLTMRDPVRGVAFIGIARTRNPMRQRSTLAHELAHVVFDDWDGTPSLTSRSPQEVRADAFARHLLVPLQGVAELLGDRDSVAARDLSTVVQSFLVSPAMAAIALQSCGYIDESTKHEWMTLSTLHLATCFGWSDQYASLQNDADRLRSPQRLLARAINGYGEGVISAQAIATLRGISLEAATDELSAAGIIPRTPRPPWLSAADLPMVSVDLSDLDDERPEDTTP
ncbi:ImmA/IrrE family metallo-endopeptidase [Pseudactinotalea sp. HY160]|uniref:ImmA/IrrE family metallo-endopeptidase n=1 Tax=Pseudactinotalea sp. HY160 TaxID=2654490 RepID=UPI00128E44FC|nr:ImmA/IrrE family metallo-endopeptidase [Pseudactinotalea sp. HY160]MPV51155.1 ImmA/IrrE family metallo-endopeptidase [Pseudactinotalea sp. HY160]